MGGRARESAATIPHLLVRQLFFYNLMGTSRPRSVPYSRQHVECVRFSAADFWSGQSP